MGGGLQSLAVGTSLIQAGQPWLPRTPAAEGARELEGRQFAGPAQQRKPTCEDFDVLARHISGFQKGLQRRLWGIDNPTDNLTGRSGCRSACIHGKILRAAASHGAARAEQAPLGLISRCTLSS